MKRFLFFCFILIANIAFTQVNFKELTLQEAFKEASRQGKIVFVQFVSASCKQCNEVADRAFVDKKLGTTTDEKCISIKMDLQSTDRNDFIEKYNSDENIGSFFFTGDADLLHRTTTTTSFANAYIQDINLAYNLFSEGRMPLKELDNLWATDKGDFSAMEMNLKRRAQLSLPLDSLLDVYVSLLPADSLTSFHKIQFIVKNYPIINSYASMQVRKDIDVFNQAWYRMSLQERVKINNRIIYKTRLKAIKTKDKNLALMAANFARNVQNNPNASIARKAYDYQMLEYYKGISDTLNFLRSGVSYCDNYYMNISKDSILRVDSMYKQKQLGGLVTDTLQKQKIIAKSLPDTAVKENKTVRMVTKQTVIRMVQTPFANEISNTLSNYAKAIHGFSNNQLYNQKALSYAERAASIAENSESYNIYAVLLYKNNQIKEAIEWEEKAIALAQKHNFGAPRYESILAKMKLNESITAF